MMHLNSGLTTKDLQGYTVIIPSYSIVNAAQLAMDILIASKKMEYIGQITDCALVPIFGHTAFEHNPEENAVSCELYADKKSKLLAIQFRTMMVLEYGGPFHKKLAIMLKGAKVKRVIVVSSAVQYEHEGLTLQYEASESFKKAYEKDLDAVKWKEHLDSEIIGGGNDKLLMKAFNMQDLPVMILYSFVSSPTDAVEKKGLFRQVTGLIKNFLKSEEDFTLTLPIGWNNLIESETGEMMY